MDPRRHRRVCELFARAVELDRPERGAFLDRETAADPALRREVQSLLAADEHAQSRDAVASSIEAAGESVASRVSVEFPEQIGRYPILRELGRGGMGVVYLARDPSLQRDVALKTVSEEFTQDSEWLSRFEDEARLLASINNPNIATVYSLERSGQRVFLTMELVLGESLGAILSRGPLALGDALVTGRQIAAALEAAHNSGVAHLDLKPTNVMRAASGQIKVLDFGLARTLTPTATSAGTGDPPGSRLRNPDDPSFTEWVLGTPGYMSPEQIRRQPADFASDLWSLACIVFECLTGRRLFHGSSALARIEATLRGDIPWDALPEGLSEATKHALAKCLERDPVHRSLSATEIRRIFDDAIVAHSIPRVSEVRGSTPMPGSLPFPVSSFVGREEEIRDVTSALASHRLVTLTGVGGCGKTRLSMEVARNVQPDFENGVCFVELVAVLQPDRVDDAVADALEIRQQTGRAVLDSVIDVLHPRKTLLVLDNCEHRLESVARLATSLLQRCPNLRILATSRERLSVAGEFWYPVPSLRMPPPDSHARGFDLSRLLRAEAIALFMDRARSVRRSFDVDDENARDIVRICERLDGIPLALEFAAARLKTLSPGEIVRRLDERFLLLSARNPSVAPKHQTLRATMEWSYNLLTESEQRLFRRLAVFSGGWRLGSAESICAGDPLETWELLDLHTRLVEKSLLEVESVLQGQVRYRMLETVREFAADKLADAGETHELQRRHREHFLALAEDASSGLEGPEQSIWLRRIQAEEDNLRSALHGLLTATPASLDEAVRMMLALWLYWEIRGRWSEARAHFGRAIERGLEGVSPLRQAEVRLKAGTFAYRQGAYEQSEGHFIESLAISRNIGARRVTASALNNMAGLRIGRGEYTAARPLFEECVEVLRTLGDERAVAVPLDNLGIISTIEGAYDAARAYHEESLRIRRAVSDLRGVATCLHGLGNAAFHQGEIAAAENAFRESLTIRETLGDRRGVASSKHGMGIVALERGRLEEARTLLEESRAIRNEIGDQQGIAGLYPHLAGVALAAGDYHRAIVLASEGITLSEMLGHRLFQVGALAARAKAHLAAQANSSAVADGSRCLEVALQIGFKNSVVEMLRVFGVIAVREGNVLRAARLCGAAEALGDDVISSTAPERRPSRDAFRRALEDARTSGSSTPDGPSPPDIDRAWESGRSLSLEEAVRLAAPGR